MPVKILVVDDEPDLELVIRQKFRQKIRENQYQFAFVHNGIEALEKLKQNGGFDLVLSDINMPQMDGLTLLVKLNEMNDLLKTVMVSAYSDMKNIRTAMNRGAYDFVIKPIDFQDLEITINKTLQELQTLKQAVEASKKLNHIQQELNVATEIQQSVLPRNFSIFPNGCPFEIYAEMIPAKEVGGDFYDFFLIDKDHLGVEPAQPARDVRDFVLRRLEPSHRRIELQQRRPQPSIYTFCRRASKIFGEEQQSGSRHCGKLRLHLESARSAIGRHFSSVHGWHYRSHGY
jgi:CheY-like chemotaxis protein